MLILVDRRCKCTKLICRCDPVRIFLGAGAAVKNARRIRSIVAARVSDQRLACGNRQRRLERLVIVRAGRGVLHGLVVDQGLENRRSVGCVKIGRADDFSGDDLLILHGDAHNNRLVLIAAIVHAVLVIVRNRSIPGRSTGTYVICASVSPNVTTPSLSVHCLSGAEMSSPETGNSAKLPFRRSTSA